MILGSMISFLFGAALGQRFSVLVLVPATAIVMALSVGAGIAHPQAVWGIIKLAAVAAVSLQCGYFAGIIVRHLQPATLPDTSAPGATAKASTHPAAH